MRKLTVAALCGSSIFAFNVTAHAQTTIPEDVEITDADEGDFVTNDPLVEESDAVDTIIVTARRREESVQDVPLVVNTVSAEDFAQLNIREFNDIQQLVPGLQLSNNANAAGANAQLRGVNFDVNISGFNNTVEFYLNDAPVLPQIVLQQTYDVAQVEVLRGPQGTLRGRAAPSGSLTVTTRKPDLFEVGGYMSMTGNDIGTINFNGGVGVPIIEGVAAIRVSGLWAEDEVNRVRTVNGGLDARDPFARTKSARVSAVIEPVDWLNLEGTYQRLDRRARFYDQVESFSAVNNALGASPNPIFVEDRRGITELPRDNKEIYDIFTWQASVGFAGQNLIYVGSDVTADFTSFEPQDFGNFFPNYEFGQDTLGGAKSKSHEIRLQNEERLFDMFDYVVGAFFRETKSPTVVLREGLITLPANFGGRIAAAVEQDILSLSTSEEQSFFGNLTFHLGESTQISGGVRYIDFKSANTITLNAVNTLDVATRQIVATTPLGIQLNSATTDTDKLIYQVTAQHFFTPDIMVYAGVGSSFRPGAFAVGDFSVAQSALERSFLQVDEETSTSYEVGTKTTLFGGRARFNLTGYYQEFENYPYRVPGGNGAGVYYVDFAFDQGTGTVNPRVNVFNFVSAVPVEVFGLEGEAAFEITPNWDISLVAAYADGKIKGGTIPCNDFGDQFGGIAGDGVPDSPVLAPTLAQLQGVVGANNLSACGVDQRATTQPKFSATAQTEYSMPISPNVDGFLRGLFSFYGKTEGDPTNAFDSVDEYGLLNLFTGIRDPDGMWEVNLFAKNLFDVQKVTERGLPLNTGYQSLPLVGFGPGGFTDPIFGSPQNATFTSTYSRIRSTPPQEFGLNVRFAFGAR